ADGCGGNRRPPGSCSHLPEKERSRGRFSRFSRRRDPAESAGAPAVLLPLPRRSPAGNPLRPRAVSRLGVLGSRARGGGGRVSRAGVRAPQSRSAVEGGANSL